MTDTVSAMEEPQNLDKMVTQALNKAEEAGCSSPGSVSYGLGSEQPTCSKIGSEKTGSWKDVTHFLVEMDNTAELQKILGASSRIRV